MLTGDKIYSNVIQETQAEAALIEVTEETFQDHLSETDRDQNKTGGDCRDINKDGKTSATDKVVPFGQFHGPQKQKPNKDFSWFCISRRMPQTEKDIKKSLTKNSPKLVIHQQVSNMHLMFTVSQKDCRKTSKHLGLDL